MAANVNLSAPLVQKFYDNSGNVASGAKLFCYAAGTNTKQAVYTDSSGTVACPNPVVLDATGSATFWPDTSVTYKYVLAPSNDTDPPTSPYWTRDGVATPANTVQAAAAAAAGAQPYVNQASASATAAAGSATTATNQANAATAASAVVGAYPNSAATTVPSGVANGQGYWVQSTDGNFLNHYVNNAGVATADNTVGPIQTATFVESFRETLFSVSQTIGRSSAPTDGTAVGNNAYVWNDAVSASGVLTSMKLFVKATGTLKLARFTVSGSTATRVAEASITLGSTGLHTLTSADFGYFPVNAGDVLGLYGNGLFTYTSNNADGTGWQQGTYGPTVTLSTFSSTLRLEAQFNISTQSVSASSVSSSLATLKSNTAQQIGRPYGVALVTGSGIGFQCYVPDVPVAAAGSLYSVDAYINAAGTLTISRFTRSGNNLTLVESRNITVGSTGVQTFVGGVDFPTLNVNAGDYIGVSGQGTLAYTSGGEDSDYLWGGPGSGAYTPNTGTTFQIRYSFQAQTVTAANFNAVNGGGSLSLANVDKICVVGNSYFEGAAALLGKSAVPIASSLSEFNWANFSKGGSTVTDLINYMTNGTAYFGAPYPLIKPRYTIFCEQTNSVVRAGWSDATYYAAYQKALDTIRGFGSTPIILTEWGQATAQSGYLAIVDGEERNVKGLRELADANGSPFIDGTSKSRFMNPSEYAAFWESNHPGTRVGYIITDALRKTAQILPRPLRSMKIFRVRGTVTVNTTADLAYRTVQDRHRLFREIYVGHMAIADTQKQNYDTAIALYADGGQTQADEYYSLAANNAVSLGTYALIDCVLPSTAATGLSLQLSDTSCTVYVRQMNGGGISWVACSLVNGVYVVPDGSGFVDRDRVAFLVYKATGVSLSASPVVTWVAGLPRQVTQPNPVYPPRGSEMLAQPLTVVSGAVPAQWTNSGALAAVTPVDNILPVGTTGCVEVTSTAGLSQAVSYSSSDDPTEIAVRVWARRWVTPFNPAGNFSTAPVTYETCDTATLQVTLCGASGLTSASAILKDQVGLHWTEIEFRETLPAGTTATTVDVRSADQNIQIAKVSVRAA